MVRGPVVDIGQLSLPDFDRHVRNGAQTDRHQYHKRDIVLGGHLGQPAVPVRKVNDSIEGQIDLGHGGHEKDESQRYAYDVQLVEEHRVAVVHVLNAVEAVVVEVADAEQADERVAYRFAH